MNLASLLDGITITLFKKKFSYGGYRSMKDPGKLLALCKEGVANPAFAPNQPAPGETHCNQFADFVAKGMGCNDLEDHANAPIMADSIYAMFLANPDKWKSILDMNKSPSSSGAAILASAGNLVFGIMTAAQLKQGHGHIVPVIPGDCEFSGHWNGLAPACANVGIENFMTGLVSELYRAGDPRHMNFSFKTVPNFFAWIPSL